MLSSGDIHRITKTIRGPKPSGPSGKAAQHSHSVQRAAKWGNTIHAQSQKKIQDKVDTEAIAEVGVFSSPSQDWAVSSARALAADQSGRLGCRLLPSRLYRTPRCSHYVRSSSLPTATAGRTVPN